MQEGDSSEASLREMAERCRALAACISDERAATSLRKLAEEYDQAGEAARTRSLYGGDTLHYRPLRPR